MKVLFFYELNDTFTEFINQCKLNNIIFTVVKADKVKDGVIRQNVDNIILNNDFDIIFVSSRNVYFWTNIWEKYYNIVKTKKVVIIKTSYCYDYFPVKKLMDTFEHKPYLQSFVYYSTIGMHLNIKSNEYNFGVQNAINKVDLPIFKFRQVKLSKIDFYKKYNLNENKKLFVFFPGQSEMCWDETHCYYKLFESERNIIKNLSKIKSVLSDYELVIKDHRIKTINKSKFKNNIICFYENQTFIDNNDENELLEYADYSIISSITSVQHYLYIYNIKTLYVDQQINSWMDFLNTFRFRIFKNKSKINELIYGLHIKKFEHLMINDYIRDLDKITNYNYSDHLLYNNEYNLLDKDKFELIINFINNI